MTLPGEPDREALIFLEQHETQVHALPGREIRDLGDAVLLLDPRDREPFWNRVAAVRWPTDARAFDRRLAETTALFATLDRIPHIWPRPAWNDPPDLVARLLAHGWEDVGGGLLMVLADAERVTAVAAETPGRGITIERLDGLAGLAAARAGADVAQVLAESFDVDPTRAAAIEVETIGMWQRRETHAYLVRVDGEPAAVAKRTTFGGASYLSSIGTRPSFRGRGLGRIVTAAASADAVAAGERWTYLGVYAENLAAVALYRGLGFRQIGDPTPDLLLR